jgi:DNA mismatch repair ATPase MutS
MKVHLMYKDRDFDLKASAPALEADLVQDLELSTLFGAMAAGDAFLQEVAHKAVLTSLKQPEAIRYRQQILADCVAHPAIVRDIYALTVETIEKERKIWGWSSDRYPEGLLHRSINVLELFVSMLKRLRRFAEDHRAQFHSEGFTTLFDMLVKELGDDYLAIVANHLRRLQFREGLLISARLDRGNQGAEYILRTLNTKQQTWIERLISWIKECFIQDRSGYVYKVPDRDESGFRALEELKGQGISHVARALAQSTDHILDFFTMLRLELGFYVSCVNLRDRLAEKHEPVCFPEPTDLGKSTLVSKGLYDICLSLSITERVVGNDIDAAEKSLVMITGANRGGKSTFLRSVGLAQLMMQCGMFAPAEAFRGNVCDRIFTHYKRQEDASMKSGKLDEELNRMSVIIDNLTPGSMVLFNESFASTNEREGSEIARQIVRALLERGIKVFYVTHLFDLAHSFSVAQMDTALFLRAERLGNRQRTFRLVEGEPLPTSYGEDVYRRIFGGANDVTSWRGPVASLRPSAQAEAVAGK